MKLVVLHKCEINTIRKPPLPKGIGIKTIFRNLWGTCKGVHMESFAATAALSPNMRRPHVPFRPTGLSLHAILLPTSFLAS